MNKIVRKINSLRDKMMQLSADEMISYAAKLKERRLSGEKENHLLPEAFALVREASRRAINKEHYDVQLWAGVVLSEGKIAEAKTGEGKTITIYLPAFLASLNGQGVHVVTVNDYLANRDATEAKQVFDLLGVSVGCVLNQDDKMKRKEEYAKDITYVTNSELGFDYLKDNIALKKEWQVLRGFHYAIIDEIDSILIDEAKTPLIISDAGGDDTQMLQQVNSFVKTLSEGIYTEASTMEKIVGGQSSETGDYIKNEKEKQIYLTERGIQKVEKAFGVEGYGSAQTLSLQRAINNALRANYLMQIDHDYVVRDDKVEIVDTFTGRVLSGRRYSDGLHQALETKENVTVQKENITIASITFQSFFNMYEKKAGLTGTAMTSAKEFKDVYHLNIVEIPTNKPVIRKDYEDEVYRTKEEKWAAVVKNVKNSMQKGQPVLIGTSSIQDSEIVSNMLDKENIPHNTLNAKNEALEAEIIATAGTFGSVTVATNMAGRGTDIILDEKAKAAGGLFVIGTERHDSRRIDNQLKGRSGRQGDPGESKFIVSMQDRVMRVFGDSNMVDTMMMIATEYGQPIQHRALSKLINKAQDAVETENRLVRESMLKYDKANNEHREQIYEQRNEILCSENPREILLDMFCDISDELVDKYIVGDAITQESLGNVFNEFFQKVAMINVQIDPTGMKKSDLKEAFVQLNNNLIGLKEQEFGDQELSEIVERATMLRFIDRNWSQFLSSMEYIKQNIGSQSYAQRDPSVEYRKRGLEVFNEMIEQMKYDIVRNFMLAQIRRPEQPTNNK